MWQRLRRREEAASAKRRIHTFGSLGANELDFVELRTSYGMQFKRGVKPQDAIGTELARCGILANHPHHG